MNVDAIPSNTISSGIAQFFRSHVSAFRPVILLMLDWLILGLEKAHTIVYIRWNERPDRVPLLISPSHLTVSPSKLYCKNGLTHDQSLFV